MEDGATVGVLDGRVEGFAVGTEVGKLVGLSVDIVKVY